MQRVSNLLSPVVPQSTRELQGPTYGMMEMKVHVENWLVSVPWCNSEMKEQEKTGEKVLFGNSRHPEHVLGLLNYWHKQAVRPLRRSMFKMLSRPKKYFILSLGKLCLEKKWWFPEPGVCMKSHTEMLLRFLAFRCSLLLRVKKFLSLSPFSTFCAKGVRSMTLTSKFYLCLTLTKIRKR